jgi:beta-N-acetylhexosaminidase
VRVGACELFEQALRKEGFNVDVFQPSQGYEGGMKPYSETTGKYDLILYIANLGTRSNQTTVRIEWAMPMGANVPIFINSVPTVFISVENPYHLLDVPRVKTFINTYASTDTVLEALMEKLTGRSEFKGVSPVDAFCGLWDARL